uniref:Uncharacterized protein n=1 Tax=Opuntia streptacantha TaxID=393608 RepID=A0A7C8ZRV8_OPUST
MAMRLMFPFRLGAASATCIVAALLLVVLPAAQAVHKAFRRDPGSPHWHHSAFHDVKDSVRSDVRRMLHTRAEVSCYFLFLSRVSLCWICVLYIAEFTWEIVVVVKFIYFFGGIESCDFCWELD